MAQTIAPKNHDSPEKFLMECVGKSIMRCYRASPRKPPSLPEIISGAGEGI
jgi:hypothetical protein